MQRRLCALGVCGLLFGWTSSAWAIVGGYAWPNSVAQGDSVDFYISTDAPTYTIKIYREGEESDLMRTISGLDGRERSCDEPGYETGCGWPVSYTLDVPTDWPSGHYIATFSVGSSGSSEKYLLFTVREDDPGSTSRILMTIPTNSYHAYNGFAGKSLYTFNSSDGEAARKVSYLRPYTWMTPRFGKFFTFGHPFVAWAESAGYTVEYGTSLDLHRDPDFIRHYSVYVTVGHDEYWTREMRDNLEAFVRAGGSAMILSGNTCWWQSRLSSDLTTLTCYKSKALSEDPFATDGDPSNDGLITTNFHKAPVDDIETSFLGLSFLYGGYHNRDDDFPYAEGFGGYRVYRTGHWLFEGTGLSDGDMIGRDATIVGDEVDGTLVEARDSNGDPAWDSHGYYPRAGALPYVVDADVSKTPPDFVILGLAPATDGYGLMGVFSLGDGEVFNAGTIEWAQGLEADADVQRITANVLDRFMERRPPGGDRNQKPVARIVSIDPAVAPAGTSVRFMGAGEDEDGSVVAFSWRSSRDGLLSTFSEFSTETLSVGDHTIYLRVQDDAGLWSDEVRDALSVTPAGAGAELILDNGDLGTSSIGTWKVSGASGPYGLDSLYAGKLDPGPTYTFRTAVPSPGAYEVSVWWTVLRSRETEVPIEIDHLGGTHEETVDQTQNGSRWNSLGVFTFDGTAEVRIRALGRGMSTCADAVRLVQVDDGTEPPTASIVSIDPNPATEGQPVELTGAARAGDGEIVAYEWTSDRDGPLSDELQFSTAGLSSGTHRIGFRVQDEYDLWSAPAEDTLVVEPLSNDDPRVTLLLIDPLEATRGDPVHFRGEGDDPDGEVIGYEWSSDIDRVLSLDPVFTSTSLSVGTHTISFRVRDDNGAWSDPETAMLLIRPGGDPAAEIIVDNGDPETSSTGTWKVSGVSGQYGEDSVYAGKIAAGRTFTYLVSLVPGSYDVYMWWAASSSRDFAVPVEIAHADGTEEIAVNQQENGGRWNHVGTYAFAGNARLTITSRGIGYSTNADAVRFVPTDGEPPPDGSPAEKIIDNGAEGTTASGVWKVSGVGGHYGADSFFASRGDASARYSYATTLSGEYGVDLWWTASGGRDPEVPIDVEHAGGTASLSVNQQRDGSRWNRVGTFRFTGDASVTIGTRGLDFTTCADAVRFVRVGD